MPGAGNSRPDSLRDLSPQPRRPVTKLRRPSPTRTRGPSVDRASSPVALPGVEITVHELSSPPKAESCLSLPSGVPQSLPFPQSCRSHYGSWAKLVSSLFYCILYFSRLLTMSEG